MAADDSRVRNRPRSANAGQRFGERLQNFGGAGVDLDRRARVAAGLSPVDDDHRQLAAPRALEQSDA